MKNRNVEAKDLWSSGNAEKKMNGKYRYLILKFIEKSLRKAKIFMIKKTHLSNHRKAFSSF